MESPTTLTVGNESVQQADVPIVSPRRHSRAKAAASPLPTSNTPAAIEPSPQNSIVSSDATEPSKNKSRGRGKAKPNSNANGKMNGPLKSIPPHLRKRAAEAAAAAATQQKVESSAATNESSIASESSKPGQGVKLDSSP